jgi:hypothetical protein
LSKLEALAYVQKLSLFSQGKHTFALLDAGFR